ncbi:MAG: DNA repair protein RadC [Oscillospiraceae bacterium]|nr:DNA repair protein RadC [Oscillospiraceae bacterium]
MATQHNHQGHRRRQKERFRQTGFVGFEPHNILETLLFYSIPQRDTNNIAHELMTRFGSLSAVFDASYEDLLQVKGISENSATLIKMIPQLANAYLNDRNATGTVMDSVEKVGAFLLNKYVGVTNERIYLLCLDSKLKLINCTVMGEGSINKVNFSPRRIIEKAIQSSASAIVLAHNHPNGTALPSDADILMTRQLYEMARIMEIDLQDHIIVAGDDFVSLAQTGILSRNIY